MQKILLFLSAFLFFSGTAFSQVLYNFAETFRNKHYQMIKNSSNELESWMVGGEGDFIINSGKAKIEKQISKSDLNSIYVFDEQNALVAGNSGELLFTENRGDNWKKIQLDTKTDLTSVFCFSKNNCWIVGNKDGLFISGGINKTWKIENIISDGKLEDIFFVNEKIGFAVGRNNLLLKTIDGGENWTRINLSYETDVSQFIDGVFWFESVSFLDDKIGCITGWDVGTGIVACTQDQGKTWKTTLFDSERFIGIVWTKKKKAHLIGKDGRNFVSMDYGLSWQKDNQK